MENKSKDIHGRAILDFFLGNQDINLIIHTSYGEPEEMPVEVFFRDELDFTTLEHLALMECRGKILDLGAGAGAHSLSLQEKGFEVVALENSPRCIEVMKQLGVQQCIFDDYENHHESYDTVLVLMNGLGLAGKLNQVGSFIRKCMSIVKPGGQLLVDSSNISYLYSDISKPKGYFGEVSYQYEYKNEKGDWFDWVYVDQEKLKSITDELGYTLEILITDENSQYLARIAR